MTDWENVWGLLASAIAQSIPSDDQIILDNVRKAKEIAFANMQIERKRP